MKKMYKESAKNSSSFAPAKSRAITVKVTVTSDYGKEIAVEEEFNVPRGQRLLPAEMLDLMIQLGANRAHTAAEEEYALYDYYSAGIEAPSFRLRAIQTEVADSYAAGDFYVHRGGMIHSTSTPSLAAQRSKARFLSTSRNSIK